MPLNKFYLFAILFTCYSVQVFAQNTWRLRACLPGVGRNGPTNFSIGNKAYLVGGGGYSPTYALDEVWEYDDSTNIWTQKHNFPHTIAGGAVFVINDTAYVGNGIDVNFVYHSDFWKYNAASDQWIPIDSFPGPPRYLSMTFVLNGKGYLGCGHGGGQNNDFYEYNPVANAWTQRASFPGSARQDGFGIAVGSYGYMGLGLNTSLLSDCYKYDPVADAWSPIASFPGPIHNLPGYFTLGGGSFYIAGGANSFESPYGFSNACWQYDTASDTWTEQASFACLYPPIITCYGFTINGHGYITCGADSNFVGNELLEFGPPDTAFIERVHILGNDTAYCGNFSRVLSTGNSCTLWSTGVTASEITVTTPGTYWAYLADPDTCGMESDTIHITAGTPVAINLGSDTAYCGSFSRTLFTGDSATVWNTGATAAQITVNAPGTYWATISNGCGTVSDTIRLMQNLLPVVNIGSDTAYCGSFTRILSTGNPETLWSTGVTASQITVNTAGTYWATDSNTCGFGSDTVRLTQNPVPVVNLGDDTTLCNGQDLILFANYTNSTYQWQDNSTNATYIVTATGEYSVTVTTSFGCTASDAIKVIYDAEPPIIDLGNDTAYCGNFSRVLYAGAPSTEWSTGVSASQITVHTAGTYWATASNACGTTSDTIQLTDNPVPVVNLGNDTTICSGQMLVLNATYISATYQWQNNSTASTDTVTQGGIYSVTVSVSNCTSSGSVKVTVDSVGPVMLAAHPDTICSNDSSQVCAPDGYTTYAWNVGGNENCVEAKSAGDYYVTVTDSHGCSVQSNPIAIWVYPVPSVSVIVEGDTLSSYNAVTYQWLLNDSIIPNATSTIYIAKEPGLYSLDITDTNGCNEVSQQFAVTGIEELTEDASVLLYPNPSSVASVQLAVGSELIGTQLEVYDDEGRLVFQSAIRNPKSQITVAGLPNGVYFLRISSADVSIVRKLVKEALPIIQSAFNTSG